jgi:hypothetical protein
LRVCHDTLPWLISVAGLKLAPSFAKLAIALQEDETNLIWISATAMAPSPSGTTFH